MNDDDILDLARNERMSRCLSCGTLDSECLPMQCCERCWHTSIVRWDDHHLIRHFRTVKP